MKGQLLGRILLKPKAWVLLGKYQARRWCFVEDYQTHSSTDQKQQAGWAAQIHLSVSNHAAWPCFPWLLGLVRNTHSNTHHLLPWHPSLHVCVHESECGHHVYLCTTYRHLCLGNDSQPIINLSARFPDMFASSGGHFLSIKSMMRSDKVLGRKYKSATWLCPHKLPFKCVLISGGRSMREHVCNKAPRPNSSLQT